MELQQGFQDKTAFNENSEFHAGKPCGLWRRENLSYHGEDSVNPSVLSWQTKSVERVQK